MPIAALVQTRAMETRPRQKVMPSPLPRTTTRGSSSVAARLPLFLQPKFAISKPGDLYEQEADRVAEQVMRMPEPRVQRQGAGRGLLPSPGASPVAQGVIQRQSHEEEPDPLADGLGTVAENLGENNPAFSALTSRLADDFLSQPAELSIGVPLFIGTNYAFLWGMALANPAMRRHFDDFNLAMLPGIIPQFPVKTFTYRIMDEEQTRFEFDLGLDASALMELFNEGVFDTRVSTLSFDTSGDLDTTATSHIGLSSLQVNLGLFDDGLMLSGGFRQGISPYPLFERNAATGESMRIGAQSPPLPDLFPERQDVRFMLQLDAIRLWNYFNPGSPPIRSLPREIEGDRLE